LNLDMRVHLIKGNGSTTIFSNKHEMRY